MQASCRTHSRVSRYISYFILFYVLIMHMFHVQHILYATRLSRSISFKNKNENLLLNRIVLKIFTRNENNFLNLSHDCTTHYINLKNHFLFFLLSFLSYFFSFFFFLCPTPSTLSLHRSSQPHLLLLTLTIAPAGGPIAFQSSEAPTSRTSLPLLLSLCLDQHHHRKPFSTLDRRRLLHVAPPLASHHHGEFHSPLAC